MQMETFMKGNGKTTKLMDLENTITPMGHAMRVTGEKISSMATARRHGLMEHVMRVNTKMAKKMDLENLTGPTIQHIRDNSLTTIYMEWVCTHGPMAVSTMVTGSIIRCTGEVSSLGQTAGDMMGTTMTIESRVSEFSYGLMVADTKGVGSMENSMV
jgi:hypothetical protein